MEDEYSRVEKDKNLYTNEVKSSKFLDILLHIFITLAVLITILCWQDVYAASDYHNVVTNAIYTGTTHCTTNQNGICTSDTSSTSYSRYTFGTTSYQNTLSMNFKLNTSIRANVNATIRLTGNYWANVIYTCQSSHFTNCRVVRANSTILNINFSNTSSSAVTYAEFFITANGSSLNTNSTFYVQKADLYETLITDNTSSSNDVINNQNQNTQDVINNQNENTENIISNANQNTQDLIENINGAFSELEKSERVNNSTCYNNGSVILAPSLEGYYIADTNGGTNVNVNYNVSYNYGVYGGQQYTIDFNNIDGLQYGRLCWYKDDTLLSCPQYRNMTGFAATNFVVTAPNDANYISLTYKRNVVSTIKGKICVSDSVMEQSAQKNEMSFLEDDSVDQEQANDFFSDFEDNDNGGISGLITKPLTIINNLLSNNSSCQNLTLPTFMGVTDAYLPSGCILWNNAPSTVITLWNTLIVGLGSYYILKKLFNDIQALKNPENDKVEVMDL